MAHLLDHCPLLSSFYDEVPRPGRQVLAPFRQMHLDPKVYGADAQELSPRRFADNPRLLRSTSWRPFGGGNTHCPGRFLARREVYMVLSIVLFRFDVRLAPGPGRERQRFPVLDTSIRKSLWSFVVSFLGHGCMLFCGGFSVCPVLPLRVGASLRGALGCVFVTCC